MFNPVARAHSISHMIYCVDVHIRVPQSGINSSASTVMALSNTVLQKVQLSSALHGIHGRNANERESVNVRKT